MTAGAGPAVKPSDERRLQVARWLEAVEAAIENPPERIDILCDLAEAMETEWLRLCAEAEAAT